MHVELMQCLARQIVDDRIREAQAAGAAQTLPRSQRQAGSAGVWHFGRALTRRRRRAVIAGV